MNDRGQKGNFRLTNGSSYDVTDINEPALYRWLSGEPNNSDLINGLGENCVLIETRSGSKSIGLNDQQCEISGAGGIDYYGLCEIITYKCVPSK